MKLRITALKYAESTLPLSMVYRGGDKEKSAKISFLVYLIETGRRRILADAGCETMPGFDMRYFCGPVPLLRQCGYEPEDVTDVAVTHAHHDHIEAVKRFQNANIHIQGAKWRRNYMERRKPMNVLKKSSQLFSVLIAIIVFVFLSGCSRNAAETADVSESVKVQEESESEKAIEDSESVEVPGEPESEKATEDSESVEAPEKPESKKATEEPESEPEAQKIFFTNPIRKQQDPSCYYYDGNVYLCVSHGTSVGPTLKLYKSSTIAGLKGGDGAIVWKPETGQPWSEELWGPFLCRIEDHWYIYVSADDGDNQNHRTYVLKAKTDDPMEGFDLLGPMTGGGVEDKWAVTASVFEWNGKWYYMYAGRNYGGNDEENKGEDREQRLLIAEMKSPTELATEPVIFNRPEYDWETAGSGGEYPKVLEGPRAFVSPNGTLYVVYIGSGTWSDDHCQGLMSLKEGGDPLNPEDWIKYPEPVFQKYVDSENPLHSLYGPSSISVMKLPEDRYWFIYHGNRTSGKGDQGRVICAQPLTWDENGFPVFGSPDLVTKYWETAEE